MVVIAGVLASHIEVSQTSSRSDFSVLAFSARNAGSEGEPVSSSPSNSTLTWQGRPPLARNARQASTKVINWPLSSAAPRPTMRSPFACSSSRGSNGGVFQSSSGSAGWTS